LPIMSDTADYIEDSFVEIEVEGNPNFDDGIDVFFNEENEGTLGFDPDEERTILDEALTLNQALICLPNQPDDKRLLLSHDIYTYWIRAMSGDEAPLEPCFKKYVIKRSDRCWATLESWVESLTWNQGPNRSKYLYQVEE